MNPQTLLHPAFLLPVDGSAHADCAARLLAWRASRLPGSQVIVVHVARDKESGEDAAGRALGAATALLDEAGVRSEGRRLAGEPAEAILRCAEEVRAAEIVMGSRGLGRWSGLVVGSVAMKVVQHASVPVTVVAARQAPDDAPPPTGPERLLLGTDGSSASIRAAGYVCALRAAGADVHADLTAVVGPLPPAWLQEDITPERLRFYYQQEGDRLLFEARAALENGGVPTTRHVEAGFVTEKLIHVATRTGCSRMVLGCRGRTGLSNLLLGSVAYQAMHLSPIPVTLVK
jgi:nucleotide-binding universal stress UspA family protein